MCLMSGTPEYKFTRKFRWHVKLHVMSGVTLLPWLHVLKTYWRDIHWHIYWHRVIFLTLMAVLNSILAIPDWWRYNRRVANQQLHAEPLFILGNPRTGTTHLHNLLSLDPYFTYANTFQAGFPASFITLEQVGARALLQPLLSPTRPMDAMKLTWDTPAEDEIAANCLNGGTSFYMPLVMPCCERRLRPLLTFREATTQQYTAWQDALLWFFKKVTFRDCLHRAQQATHAATSGAGNAAAPVGPRPLLIKSPVHIARFHVWRALFPHAKYVFITRHPVEVFRSSAHMVDTYFWYCYLQQPTNRQLTDYILDQYDSIYEEYMRERQHVPPEQLVEVKFEELEQDPLGVLKTIYDQMGWSERYAALVPKFKAYCSTLADFKKNDHKRLPADLEAEVRRRWAPSFKTWGYT